MEISELQSELVNVLLEGAMTWESVTHLKTIYNNCQKEKPNFKLIQLFKTKNYALKM